MLTDIINLVFSILTGVLSLLPASFIHSYLSDLNIDYLSYVNYFIPFYRFVKIGQSWLVACASYLIFYYVRSVQQELSSSAKGS